MDKKYMKLALKLAEKGEGFTSPNPLVGAVVVKDNQIVGQGYHRYYGGPHAEIYALDQAGSRARGATLYITLEPCSHFGKTPPCADRVITSGVSRVVVAHRDPNPRVVGRGIQKIRNTGIKVKTGVLADEARELNKAFIKYMTADHPYVYLKTAQTLDGYLATATGDSRWITNQQARLEGHRLRHRVDGILVGINTVLADNPSLTTRLDKSGSTGQDSLRIILDSRLRTPLTARIVNQESPAKTLIVIDSGVDRVQREPFLEKENVEILPLELNKQGRIPLAQLLKELHDRQLLSLMVEGGGTINHSFLKEGLIDEIYCFQAPVIVGGSDGVPVFKGEGQEKMEMVDRLKDVDYRQLGDNILLTGKFR
ncbi:MAG: bifunctional diaminohydroxyphosphoribosylaminopyrimidine deaminase/5-amino-6-(5-phosphoribosylamino)uracil reductase RibD [Bacillota bacterium]